MKIIDVKKIELFKNISQIQYNETFYDFHNDFICLKIILKDEILFILFRHLYTKELQSFNFVDVEISNFDYFNSKNVENLTIDNIYRGRTEKNGELYEFSKTNKGYFYLEFYEGQKLEFFSSGFKIEEYGKCG